MSISTRSDSLPNRRCFFDKRRLFLASVVLIYWLAISLLHLKFSIFLVSRHATPLGGIRPSDYSKQGAIALAIGLALFIAWRAFHGRERFKTLLYWFFLAVAVFSADRLLVFTPNEYFHFPQYAILAMLLSLLMDPGAKRAPTGKILFWTVSMGAVDESIQYFRLCASYCMHLDFNDFFLNELGGAAGLLLVYGFKRPVEHASGGPGRTIAGIFRSAEFKLVVICCVLLFSLHAAGRLSISPPGEAPPGGVIIKDGKAAAYLQREPGIMGSWRKDARGGRYYVLPPFEGLFLLAAGWALFASYGVSDLKVGGKGGLEYKRIERGFQEAGSALSDGHGVKK